MNLKVKKEKKKENIIGPRSFNLCLWALDQPVHYLKKSRKHNQLILNIISRGFHFQRNIFLRKN